MLVALPETPSEKTRMGGNLALRLTAMATRTPDVPAIVVSHRRRGIDRSYDVYSFGELEEEVNRLATGLRGLGVRSQMRIALLVRPSMEFIALLFALFKVGAVVVLVDPTMGPKRLLACLEDAKPEGFLAMPILHALRSFLRWKFSYARYNVTVGRRLFWGGITLDELRLLGTTASYCNDAGEDSPAAIIFTTGSTGPPKGVLYTHGNFNEQAVTIGDYFGICPGEVDLAGFPLFALFNCLLGVTTIIPDMRSLQPARVDPLNIVECIHDWHVTQSFGSPAMWNRVGRYCRERKIRLPTLRRVISAGAPVPPEVLELLKSCISADGEVHTPYGSTEALPVSSITATEVLVDTRHRWAEGGGTCVGRKVPGIDWKVIRVTDRRIANVDEIEELPAGHIGELIVSGPIVTREYATRRECNAIAKIADGSCIWHRMGDVGYLDEIGRFWFCGRVAHRVQTSHGTMFSIPCEAVFNQHAAIYRSALVGVGDSGRQRPVIVVEPKPEQMPKNKRARRALTAELAKIGGMNQLTQGINDFLIRRSMPVDARHNAKILRDQLAVWARRKLG
jgi:olefin beta-lactone synthetase